MANNDVANLVEAIVTSMRRLDIEREGERNSRWDTKVQSKSPEYGKSEGGLSWKSFCAALNSHFILMFPTDYNLVPEGQRAAVQARDINKKKCILFKSITGRKSELVQPVAPGTDAFTQAETFEDYLALFDKIFRPASETNLARSRFKKRVQNPRESVQSFAAAKRSLYAQAYPGQPDESILIDSFIDGLYHPQVSRMTSVRTTSERYTSIDQCLSAALDCVAAERRLIDHGKQEDIGGLATPVADVDDLVFVDDHGRAGGQVGVQTVGAPGLALATGGVATSQETPMELGSMLDAEDLIDDDPELAHLTLAEGIHLMRGGPKRCWTCQREGHFSRECKVRKKRSSKSNVTRSSRWWQNRDTR